MANAAARAYERIRKEILNGTFSAGMRLGEEELASLTGVSRTPVREALRRLSSEGFVEFHTNRGAKVASLDLDDLRELYFLRALLEGRAARLAAEHITEDELAKLGGLADAMEALGPTQSADELMKVAALNQDFHQIIIEASRSDRLAGQLASIRHVPLVHRTFLDYPVDALLRSFSHHRELVLALALREGEWAEVIMQSHIHAARVVLEQARRPSFN